ncbi:MAG TPA: hypothetical protein VFU48_15415 [Nitrospira sp.]|nr:hypothetical protein [Nitrospira sp.]
MTPLRAADEVNQSFAYLLDLPDDTLKVRSNSYTLHRHLTRGGSLLLEMAADVRRQIEDARGCFERFSASGEQA